MRYFESIARPSIAACCALATMALVVVPEASCGNVCERGQFRCDGDGLQACATQQNGWTDATSCVTARWPDAHCVELDSMNAICSFEKDKEPACNGGNGRACVNGVVVACVDGYATGNGEDQECVSNACESEGGDADCVGSE